MDKEEDVQEFEKRVNAEIEDFNKGVDNIINTFEETLRKQIKTVSYKDYTTYLMFVMKHNEEAGEDDFMEPLSEAEWRASVK